ncbi:MAG TPA: lipopolysaccharide heptosyltransferase I [Terriglobia bacterium]|nr:lipopolysaccharide heptosyltransferase I [Terriglobia bacterium]
MRFLVIRLSSIGDIVHTLPAVAALGEAFPAAEISWAVEKRYACLVEENPYLKRTETLDTFGWRKRRNPVKTLREIAGSVRALRGERYDAVIDFQGLVKTGLIARMCRSPRRIGFAKWVHREPGAGFFYTDQVPPPLGKHVIEQNLALVEHLGASANTWQFPLPLNSGDERSAEAALEKQNIREFILVSPGGGWVAKRWSPENYAALIGKLEAEFPWAVVLTGSPAERAEIAEILRASSSRRARYVSATLGELIALARRASLFIGGDTGPLHIAAALGVPIVALYGPTDSARNGPFSAEDISLSTRQPVNHTRRSKSSRFLEGISPEEVLAAVRERMARVHEA